MAVALLCFGDLDDRLAVCEELKGAWERCREHAEWQADAGADVELLL
jgi:hypothetical protein